MNKIFLWIVLAVIILGLLLILLNTRMGQSGDAPVPADNSVSAPVKPAPPVTMMLRLKSIFYFSLAIFAIHLRRLSVQ